MKQLLFEHFVVSMFENRSFDHLLAILESATALPESGATNFLEPGNMPSEKLSSRRGATVRRSDKVRPTVSKNDMQLFA
jgi:phospholipase C